MAPAESGPAPGGALVDLVSAPHERRELTGLMGCRGSVTVVGPEDPVARRRMLTVAEWRLRELEHRWSRFLPDSEITALGSAQGRPVAVSAATRELVRHLVLAHEATRGAFDPTLLPALVDHGYRASVTDPARVTRLADGALPHFDVALIEVDDDAGTVALPVGGTLDPGGLGKGLAADLVAAELLDRGAAGVMVEIGGDLRVGGTPPWGPAWLVDVEEPTDADAPPREVVTLVDGGVATSSTVHRRWDGGHHLIDPRTGDPSDGPVVATTVVAATGAWSEVFAKVPFGHDLDGAMRLLDEEGVAALVVTADGGQVVTAHWPSVRAPR